ncbi:MAG: metal-dependent transcriptional regulator [Spirochaetes bacterium]|nr:metal-dependent transcriptional regulator [Spirochaetota bacterium]
MEYSLTNSLEDYLLEIFLIKQEKTNIRIKDIAKKRHVKFPSVVKALEELSSRNYIDHERYGYVELTDFGFEKAKKLYDRHKKVYNFLHNILGLNHSISEKDTHKIEHGLSVETVTLLTEFTNFIENSPAYTKKILYEHFRHFIKTGKYLSTAISEGVNGMKKTEEKTLKDLKIGQWGKIIRIKSGIGNLKTKLLDMGAVPGTTVKVKKVAPLGDPIDIQILGYHLTLRKNEAENIIIEEP